MPANLSEITIALDSYPTAGLSASDRTLVAKITAAVDSLQLALVKYGTVRYQIQQFEKLLCDPWMEDRKLYDRLYASWSHFRSQYEREIGGMTVNERLWHMGLMEDFEQATGNPDRLRSILRSVFLSPQNIEAIVYRHRS